MLVNISFVKRRIFSDVCRSCWSDRSVRSFHWREIYHNFLGWNEVADAQSTLHKIETEFITAQKQRRIDSKALARIHHDLNSIRVEMGKISRHEERYLALFHREHQLMKDEESVQKKFDKQVQLEEETFMEFQRARSKMLAEEKKYAAITKYRAIIGYLLAFIFGSFVATGLNQRAMRYGNTMSNEYVPSHQRSLDREQEFS